MKVSHLTFCLFCFLSMPASILACDAESLSPYIAKALEKGEKIESVYDSINWITLQAFYLLIEKKNKEAKCLSDWALQKSEKISYLFGRSESHSRLGGIYQNQEKYEQAIFHFQKAMDIRKYLAETEPSERNIDRYIGIHNNLAVPHIYLGKAEEALELLHKGMSSISQFPDFSDQKKNLHTRSILHSQGAAFVQLDKPDSAIIKFHQSLALAKPVDLNPAYTQKTDYELALLNTQLGIEDTLLDKLLRENNGSAHFMANVQGAQGQRLLEADKIEEARPYFYKSLKTRRELNDSIGIGLCNFNLGVTYLNEGDYTTAKKHFAEAVLFYKNQKQERRLAQLYSSLGTLLEAEGNTAQALAYFRKGYQLSQQQHYLIKSVELAGKLADLFGQQGETDSAFHYERLYREHRDAVSISERESIRLIEAHRSEAELHAERFSHAQERNRLINIGAAIIISALLFLLYFIIRQALQNKKIAAYKLKEKEVTQTYLQYQRKGTFQERGRLADDLHDGLGQLLGSAKSKIQEVKDALTNHHSEIEESVSLANQWLGKATQDLKDITKGLTKKAFAGFGLEDWARELKHRVEAISSMKVLIHFIDIDKPIEEEKELQLILCLQELVNNAQKYSKAPSLSIQLIREGEALNMSIEDDGVGFDVEKVLRRTKNRGVGLGSLKKRVEKKLEGSIEFSSIPGKGTSVIVDIPHLFILKNK